MFFHAMTGSTMPPDLFKNLNDLRPALERRVGLDCFGIEIGSMSDLHFHVVKTSYTFCCDEKPFVTYSVYDVTRKADREEAPAQEEITNGHEATR